MTKEIKGPNKPDMSPQVSAAYKSIHDHLMLMKRQLWVITNYMIAIFAGIFGFSKTLGGTVYEKNVDTTKVLTIIVGAALAYGIYLLLKIQGDIMRTRDGLEKLESDYFKKEEREKYLGGTSNRAYRDMPFLIALIGVSVIGAALVIWSL